jgi:uncharacterized protein (UPF0332 family)
MKSRTESYLDAADNAIRDAKRILEIEIPGQAARLAYYAQFHAAQALIFERTDKLAKTHRGTDRLSHELARVEPGLSSDLAATLTATYHFEEVVDYDPGVPISAIDASAAIEAAEKFVAAVRAALNPPP